MTAAAPAYVDTIRGRCRAMTESTPIVNAAPRHRRSLRRLRVPAAEAAPRSTAEGGAPARERDDGEIVAPAPPSSARCARQRRRRCATSSPIQQAIARGETPRDVDTFAIVQHFAAPERTPADLRVELEASATPLDATKWLLRVSVDAPGKTSAPIDLTFGDAIAAHRAVDRIGRAE